MKYIRITNWERFQQYKDRDPKWIKVYRDLLDNYEYSNLPDASKFHLLGLWLLAAKLDNKIPADARWISSRIGNTSKIKLETLESAGFIESYKTVQNDTEGSEAVVLREEKEKEKEIEKEGDDLSCLLSKYLIERVEQSEGRKLVSTPAAGAKHIKKLLDKGVSEKDIRGVIEYLTTKNLERGKYAHVVHSGKALYDKWDKIISAMTAKTTEPEYIDPYKDARQ